jgi:hypothetical protein
MTALVLPGPARGVSLKPPHGHVKMGGKAVGFISRLRRTRRGIVADVEVTKAAADSVRASRFRYVSPETFNRDAEG